MTSDGRSGIVPDSLIDLAEGDPRRAIRLGEQLLARPPSEIGLRTRAVALRAIGLSRITLGDAAGAVAALEVAGEAAHAIGDAELVGETELTLAAALTTSGELAQAFNVLDAAERRLGTLGRARVNVQRAGVVARSGDFAGCLPLYAAAEPVLEQHADARWLALLSSNRGLVHVYTGHLRAAQRDLERARDLYEQMGRDSSSAEMVHNLGFLAMRRGDIPAALAALDDAEQRFLTLGLNVPIVLLDQAEALLLAGLSSEARDLAWTASQRLAAAKLEIERSEALLIHSRTALAAQDFEAAASSARTAGELMAIQGRPGWELRARYLAAAAAAGSGAHTPRDDLRKLAANLAEMGQLFAAFHTRLLAGRVALDDGDPAAAEHDLTEAGNVPTYAPVDLRIQARLAKALLRLSQGNTKAAASAVSAGVRLLDEYRSTLGATESRVNVAGHASDLYKLGVAMAMESGQPSRVLKWIEKSRSGSLRLVRPRPPDDDRLARALAGLRTAQMETREAEVEGGFSSEMWREQARLEREVRRLALHRRGHRAKPDRPPSLRQLQDRLDGRAMVVLAQSDDELVGLRVRPRSIRMFRLGPMHEVRRKADQIRQAHRSLARRISREASDTHQRTLADTAASLDRLLFSSMHLADEQLVIIPPPGLHSLPWSALPTCNERTIVIAPSAFTWHRAVTAPPRPGRALLVAGPGLDHAEEEIQAIAELYADSVVLAGSDATVDGVLAALDSSGMAHFACHARFRSENAMFSSLRLADGDLTVYDIEQATRVPEVVVLSACESGLSQTRAGEELTGLAIVMLGMGTRSLVVSTSPVPDERSTRQLMISLHEGLRDGLSPALAMAEARSQLTDGTRVAAVTRDAFYCLGA